MIPKFLLVVDIRRDGRGSLLFYPLYLELCWSLHQVNSRYMSQVPIPLISFETTLRPFALCRGRRPSNFKGIQILWRLIWNNEPWFISSSSKGWKTGRFTPNLSQCRFRSARSPDSEELAETLSRRETWSIWRFQVRKAPGHWFCASNWLYAWRKAVQFM
jgi:hypothetical protein